MPSPSSPAGPRRVLIAEDVQVISFRIARALTGEGYEVEVASDGEECLAKARSFRPDLIVLDIMMPKLHGIDVMRQLRDGVGTRDVGVIVCTAKSFKTEHDQVEELGAFAILVKPFETRQLIEKVGEYFARHGQTDGKLPNIMKGTVGEAFRPELECQRGCFTLWGTRGSVPTPGAQFMRHGGQTSCMEITLGDERIILDAGSGIRNLGLELANGPPRRIHLFITHTHWDHIQGFPFFKPAYLPGFEIVIYGAEGFGKDLRSVFSGQLDRDYFPVQMGDMRARLEFQHLTDEPIQIGPLKVEWAFAHHPGATVGYKVDVLGRKLAWVPDNEFLNGYIGPPDHIPRDHELVAPYERLLEFLSDVDVLIHEAQYTNEEYPPKVGWGHTALSNACLLAKLVGIRRWIITHHDPLHDDRFLETKLNLTRQLLERIGHSINVTHGYDGMTEYF